MINCPMCKAVHENHGLTIGDDTSLTRLMRVWFELTGDQKHHLTELAHVIARPDDGIRENISKWEKEKHATMPSVQEDND